MLNIVPLIYFVSIYYHLRDKVLPDNLYSMFFSVLGVLFYSIVGFGIYRLFWGVMLIKNRGNFIFYGSKLPDKVIEQLDKRDGSHREALPHVIPGILWISIFYFLGRLLV